MPAHKATRNRAEPCLSFIMPNGIFCFLILPVSAPSKVSKEGVCSVC
jgi:hypothetical protein